MSRIGKKPIEILQGIDAKINDRKIIIKGPKGELQKSLRSEIKVVLKEGRIFLTGENSALLGLSRSILANMVKGVIDGYEKKLEIEGIGYKANLEDQDLVFNVGFTHPVKIKAPEGIKFSVDKNIITVIGIDKELVGQVAARIRAIKPAEPYKGKGIRYQGEQVRRKLGKKVKA